MNNTKILVVVNPISGGRDKTEIIQYLKTRAKREGYVLYFYYTKGENDKQEIRALFQELNLERAVVIGGDGTLKLLAEVMGSHPLPLGLFPAGSANGLAENLNLPRDKEALTSIALGNSFRELDSILVNRELCIHISDIGLNAELIKNYEEGKVRGKLGYLIQSIPTLIRSDFPFSFTIEIDGKTIKRKAFLVGIANARRYGTGATINPQGKYDDGKFEILIFKRFDIEEILKTFQRSTRPDPEFLEIHSATHARIRCDRKVPFQVDGEFRGEIEAIEAEISPIKVRIAVGG